MIPFLFVLSFILHFIALLIIVLQSIRLRKMFEFEHSNKTFQREVEETLSSYMLEMKEENDKFLANLEMLTPASPPQLETNVRKEEPIHKNSTPNFPKSEKIQQENTDEILPPLPEVTEEYVQSFEAQVLSLAKKGMTADEIAKQLNKGKTEIDLLLKFRQFDK